MWNSSTCDCKCNKLCKIDKYLDIKTCLCGNIFFFKFVLACEDQILNTTKA